MSTTHAELSIELRYTSFNAWGYGISDYYNYNADKNTGESVKVSGTKSIL